MILELLLFHIMLLLSSPPNYVLAEPRALLAASNSSSTNRNVTISLPFSNREDCYYDEVWYEMVVALDILQTSPGDVGFQKPNFVFSQTRNFCRIASDSLAFMAYNSTDFIINDGWCQLPASLHRIIWIFSYNTLYEDYFIGNFSYPGIYSSSTGSEDSLACSGYSRLILIGMYLLAFFKCF
ncbi:hypothetical protein WN944_006100 [Citrus x changshan-huyou]|uniref:Uncharacterized protein n=1 Tax=Citrus x changshan-huyou TaxID=2935761 RepID=A0AAP0QWV7_9ROSI